MRKKLFTLFITTFYISAFTFGGGYVIIPLMKDKFVGDLEWIDEEEMLDLVAIAQSSPGAMAINASILLGNKVAGPVGMMVSVFATALPPLLIISLIAMFYEQFRTNEYVSLFLRSMQASVCAVIFSAAYDLSEKVFDKKEPFYIGLAIFALVSKMLLNINVVYIILTTIILSIIKYYYMKKVGRV